MIIDVSAANGKISWSKAKAAGVDLAIIRLGYRGYGRAGNLVYDTQYKQNRSECERLGIPFSLYFFPTAINHDEAVREGKFIEKAASTMKDFPVPIFLDSETAAPNGNGRSDKLSRGVRTQLLADTLEYLDSVGIPGGVYASTSWLENRLDMSKLQYPVWVAQYASKCTYSGQYIMWQYSSKGKVSGISGNVDLSRSGSASWSWTKKSVEEENKVSKKKTSTKVSTYKVKKKDGTVYTLQDVRFGSRGEHVRFMQQMLNALGFHCKETTICDDQTLEALAAYQASRRRTTCGKGTWEEMIKEVS